MDIQPQFPHYTGRGGSSMASSTGKLIPVTTKTRKPAQRLTGARKVNGGLGMSSSSQKR